MTIETPSKSVLGCQGGTLDKHSCQVQVDINDKMRAILVDWLVEVHLKFKVCICTSSDLLLQSVRVCQTHNLQHAVLQLMPETLFLTMNVIDRFLEQKPMTRKNLQLVTIFCWRSAALLFVCR